MSSIEKIILYKVVLPHGSSQKNYTFILAKNNSSMWKKIVYKVVRLHGQRLQQRERRRVSRGFGVFPKLTASDWNKLQEHHIICQKESRSYSFILAKNNCSLLKKNGSSASNNMSHVSLVSSQRLQPPIGIHYGSITYSVNKKAAIIHSSLLKTILLCEKNAYKVV